jgi:hypothetical protein
MKIRYFALLNFYRRILRTRSIMILEYLKISVYLLYRS